MPDEANYIEYVKSFVSSIIRKGIDLKVAKIFGSYVKNLNNENSDIDVLLISNEFKGVGFIDYALISEELVNYHYIHAKTYSTSDYYEGDPFVYEINKDSISIL